MMIDDYTKKDILIPKSTNILPFGLLSIHYNKKYNINGYEWNSMAQYIYSNLISKDKIIVDNYSEYMKEVDKIYEKEFRKLLLESLENSDNKIINILHKLQNQKIVYDYSLLLICRKNINIYTLKLKSTKYFINDNYKIQYGGGKYIILEKKGIISNIDYEKYFEKIGNNVVKCKYNVDLFEYKPIRFLKDNKYIIKTIDDNKKNITLKLNQYNSDKYYKICYDDLVNFVRDGSKIRIISEEKYNKIIRKNYCIDLYNNIDIISSERKDNIEDKILGYKNFIGEILMDYSLRKFNDSLYKPYLVLLTISKYLNDDKEKDDNEFNELIQSNENNFDKIIDKYGKDIDMSCEFMSVIQNNHEMVEILKLSLNYPIVLLYYVFIQKINKKISNEDEINSIDIEINDKMKEIKKMTIKKEIDELKNIIEIKKNNLENYSKIFENKQKTVIYEEYMKWLNEKSILDRIKSKYNFIKETLKENENDDEKIILELILKQNDNNFIEKINNYDSLILIEKNLTYLNNGDKKKYDSYIQNDGKIWLFFNDDDYPFGDNLKQKIKDTLYKLNLNNNLDKNLKDKISARLKDLNLIDFNLHINNLKNIRNDYDEKIKNIKIKSSVPILSLNDDELKFVFKEILEYVYKNMKILTPYSSNKDNYIQYINKIIYNSIQEDDSIFSREIRELIYLKVESENKKIIPNLKYIDDEDLFLGCKLIVENKFIGENIYGKFLKNIMINSKYTFEDIKYIPINKDYVENLNNFLEKDLFMKQWMINQINFVYNIIFNISYYSDDKIISIDLVDKILIMIYKMKTKTKTTKNHKIPKYIIDEMNKMIYLFSYKDTDTIFFLIYTSITEQLNEDNLNNIKNIIYEKQIKDLDLDLDCTFDKNKIKNITNIDITNINSNEYKCIIQSVTNLLINLKNILNIKKIDINILNCIENIILNNNPKLYINKKCEDNEKDNEEYNEEDNEKDNEEDNEKDNEEYNEEYNEKDNEEYNEEYNEEDNEKDNEEDNEKDNEEYNEEDNEEDNEEEKEDDNIFIELIKKIKTNKNQEKNIIINFFI